MSLDFRRDRQLSLAYRTLRYKRVSFSFGVRSSLATYRSTSGAETNGPPMSFNFDRSLFRHLSIFKFSVSFLVTPGQVSWFRWSTQDFINSFVLFDIFLYSLRMVESSSTSSWLWAFTFDEDQLSSLWSSDFQFTVNTSNLPFRCHVVNWGLVKNIGVNIKKKSWALLIEIPEAKHISAVPEPSLC